GQVYGRPLPSATLRQAPTIAALADILEKPTPRRPSPFVHLKAGSEKPPIFIAHGLCGTVQFTELAKHIRTGHPIYGIQGKGLDADSVFPELSARARVPQRCWAYRSARQLSGALSRKLTWLTQTISQGFIVARYTS